MAKWYVSLNAQSAGDGTSWANCAAWSNINTILNNASHGDELVIEPGYVYPEQIINVPRRMYIHGENGSGTKIAANIQGTRTKIWPANGAWTDANGPSPYVAANQGSDIFRIKDAAGISGGCHFSHLTFRDVGYAIRPTFDSSSVVGSVLVEDLRAFNLNGLVFTSAAGDGQLAITGNRCKARGYSKGMFRAFNSMLLTDCVGDALSQFHDPSTNLFGAHIQDTSAVAAPGPFTGQFVRCTFMNHNAAPPAGSSKDPATTTNYIQGDGIVCEEGTDLLNSSDLILINNGDRGLDVKHKIDPGHLKRVYAWGNGYDFAAHDDTVEVYIEDSFLGSTFRAANDTRNSSCLQASGHLHATNCILEQVQTRSDRNSVFYIVGGSVQPAHDQAGATIAQRCGSLWLTDSIVRYTTGLTKALLSPGGTPHVVPTFAESGVTWETV